MKARYGAKRIVVTLHRESKTNYGFAHLGELHLFSLGRSSTCELQVHTFGPQHTHTDSLHLSLSGVIEVCL